MGNASNILLNELGKAVLFNDFNAFDESIELAELVS